MKLPTHLITQVKWFEHYFEARRDDMGSRFIVHYKQWWKRRDTIWVGGGFVKSDAAGRHWRIHPEATELLAQLKAQCPDQA